LIKTCENCDGAGYLIKKVKKGYPRYIRITCNICKGTGKIDDGNPFKEVRD
jgi:DnaJ-class molecular chaperone